MTFQCYRSSSAANRAVARLGGALLGCQLRTFSYPMKRYVVSRSSAFWILVSTLLFFTTTDSYAQWSIGASYQYRMEEPSKGVEAQLSRKFSTSGFWLDAFVQGRVGYLFDQKERDVVIDAEIVSEKRSFDAALTGGVKARLSRFRVYAGVGGGYEEVWGESIIQSWGQTNRTEVESKTKYIDRYAGMEVRVFERISLSGEYRRPFYLDGNRYEAGRIAAGLEFKF